MVTWPVMNVARTRSWVQDPKAWHCVGDVTSDPLSIGWAAQGNEPGSFTARDRVCVCVWL